VHGPLKQDKSEGTIFVRILASEEYWMRSDPSPEALDKLKDGPLDWSLQQAFRLTKLRQSKSEAPSE